MNTSENACIAFTTESAEDKLTFKIRSENSEALWDNSPNIMLKDNDSHWVSQYNLEEVEIFLENDSSYGRYFKEIVILFDKPALNFEINCYINSYQMWYTVDSVEGNSLKEYKGDLNAR